MKCTYCGKRCKATEMWRGLNTIYRDRQLDVSGILLWITPDVEWMCADCRDVATRVIKEHLAETNDVVLAALRAQSTRGGE